jgi:hypothetical protein
MKELPLKLIFRTCDLAPVLAIHTAEYVNDLQLTLDTKSCTQNWFSAFKNW